MTSVVLRVLMVWIYSGTGKNVLATILFHTIDNVSTFSSPDLGSSYDPSRSRR